LVEPPIEISSVIAFSARQYAFVVLLVITAGEIDDEVAGLDK
jgi:hypothetical protein